nr:MAG TPA: hypothetical protein [Caudoviricetes sp.]
MPWSPRDPSWPPIYPSRSHDNQQWTYRRRPRRPRRHPDPDHLHSRPDVDPRTARPAVRRRHGRHAPSRRRRERARIRHGTALDHGSGRTDHQRPVRRPPGLSR